MYNKINIDLKLEKGETMKPFVKYPGGKQKELPLIEKYKPTTIKRFFEPFVGGGSVYLNINVKSSFINDKSNDLISLYRFIKEQNKDFYSYLEELDELWHLVECDNFKSNLIDLRLFKKYQEQSYKLKSKKIMKFESEGLKVSKEDKKAILITSKKTALYMCIRDIYNNEKDNIPLRAAVFYFMREYCYSSMFRFSKTGKFNVPYGGKSYDYKYMTAKIQLMKSAEIQEYFSATEIYNLDFEEFLDEFELCESDFIFLDPPYDSEFSTYDNNSFDKTEQVRLANFLKKTKAKWMLVIKKTDFIYNLYKDFKILTYDMNYLVSFKNRNDREVEHLLITNYEVM